MQSIPLGGTALSVSALAYGCMHIGGQWDRSPLDEQQYHAAAEALETALEHGIRFFDHADIYTLGKSEEVFGRFLREKPHLRQEIVIQSKCGIRFADDPSPGLVQRYDFRYEHIVHSVENIVQRLGIERLDLLLLHRPDPLMQPEEVARAFNNVYERGLVQYFGVSNHTASQIELLQRWVDYPLVVNQIELSLLHHGLISSGVDANRPEQHCWGSPGLLEYMQLNSMLIQAYSPLAGGRTTRQDSQAEPAVQATVQLVTSLAQKYEVTPEAIAVAWLLRHPAKIQPVIGTTQPERIRACAQAVDIELSRDDWYALFTAARGRSIP